MLWSNLCLTVFWLIQSSILIRNIWVSALSGPVLVVGEQWQIQQHSSSSSAVDYFVWGDNRTHARTTQSQLWEGLQRTSIEAMRVRNRGFLRRWVVSGKNGLLGKWYWDWDLRSKSEVARWCWGAVACTGDEKYWSCLRNKGKARLAAAGSEWQGEE